MGYCDEGCEHLTRRHNCNKYHKGLTYFSYGGKSLAYSNHERCSECDKEHYIAELEEKIKKSWIPVSERLPVGKEFELKVDEKTLYQKVLVQTTNFNMYTAHYDTVAWFDDEGNALDVLYWMPLPKLHRPDSPAEGRGKR